jgi:predicted subunit of tRNA(5-methylaminomethyl-2-thiouridylate) methyltransferase
MSISIIDRELLKYVSQMDELQKKSLLDLIKTFLKQKEAGAETTTLQQYNQELEAAMERISKGSFTSLEDLEKEMQTW